MGERKKWVVVVSRIGASVLAVVGFASKWAGRGLTAVALQCDRWVKALW